MGQRHQARCVVLEVLYSIDIGGIENLEGNLQFCASLHKLNDDGLAFSRRLLKAVLDNSEEIDITLKGLIKNWNIERLAVVDKNVLRLGLGEIKYLPETPIKVAIDEAIELAKKYGSADSGRFVNGILDAAGARSGEVND
ncbi:MAG: transcription antitermination factor NusB [candidate division Zixibacteria bacterium]|jgi:N utilization substance protein B|nr:transcription antitermination factor NusB [candidate division Zixibacteria bacterium]